MLLKSRICIKTNHNVMSETGETTSFIKKFFHGTGKKKVLKNEHETFPAVPMLRQIGMVFQALRVDNIISFTHDGNEFYSDTEEKPGDLPGIIKKFNEEINRLFGEYLGAIKFSVETEQEGIHYSLLTAIHKVHPAGAYPIVLDISGLVDRKKGGAEDRYYFFIDQLELALNKYLPVHKITVDHGVEKNGSGPSFPAGEEDGSPDQKLIVTAADDKGAKKTNPGALFPLFKVTPGKTTVKELERLGKHTSMRDSEGNLYKYYVVKGLNFWYDNGAATHMYITYTDPLPDQWRRMGFSWEHSYAAWMKLFEKLHWETQLIKEPRKVKHFTGKGDSFEAEVMVSAESGGMEYILRLDFSYSNKTGVLDTGTLYSISINTP